MNRYITLASVVIIISFLLGSFACFAEGEIDPRFAVCGVRPTPQDFALMDAVGARWGLNWNLDLRYQFTNGTEYPFVRMYGEVKAGEYTDEEIQEWARKTRELNGPD